MRQIGPPPPRGPPPVRPPPPYTPPVDPHSPDFGSPATITQGSPVGPNHYIDPDSGLEYQDNDEEMRTDEHSAHLFSQPAAPVSVEDNYLVNLAAENNRRRQREAAATAPPPPPVVDEPGTVRMVERPDAGWPQIHGTGPGYLWDNLAPEQMRNWLADRKPNVLVQVHGQNSWDANAGQMADDIAGIIKEIYSIESISVAPGNEILMENGDSGNKNKHDPPHTYLVQDISQALAERLINTTCIATPTLQLMFYPMRFIGPNTYIGSISGFVATNLVHITEARKSQLCDDIRLVLYKQAQKELMDYICRNIPDSDYSDVAMNPDGEVRKLLGNLGIKIVNTMQTGKRKAATVNMYLELDQHDPKYRDAILEALERISFRTDHFGAGIYHAGWKCTGCRGTDHPSGLCPYKLIPTWNEVTGRPPTTLTNTTTPPNMTNTQHARGAARGRRPAGAARGGRGANGYRGSNRGRA